MKIVMQLIEHFKRLSLMKKVIVVAITAVVGFITVPKVLPSKSNATYQTATVQSGTLISSISVSGNVSSTSQTEVTSPTDGVIEELYVANGDVVAAGQNLFKVKSTATDTEKATAYASYLSSLNSTKSAQQSKTGSQAALEQARQAVLDAQDAVDTMNSNRINNGGVNPATKQPYTQNEMDSITSKLASARMDFSAAESKYNQSDTSIGAASASQNASYLAYLATQDSVVTAPANGTVANLSVSVGSNVSGSSKASSSSTSSSSSSSSNSSSSSPIMIIGDFSSLTIKTQINETDITKVKEGQKATITLDAFGDKTFVGRVDHVDTVGTTSSGVVTYNAYVSFISPPPNIMPGMSATVVIQTDRKDNALSVPTTAISTTNGTSTVRVLKNGVATPVEVETGISSDTDTEIISGLNEGDTVVTNSFSTTTGGSSTRSPFGGSGIGGFGGGGFGGGRSGGGNVILRRGG